MNLVFYSLFSDLFVYYRLDWDLKDFEHEISESMENFKKLVRLHRFSAFHCSWE